MSEGKAGKQNKVIDIGATDGPRNEISRAELVFMFVRAVSLSALVCWLLPSTIANANRKK